MNMHTLPRRKSGNATVLQRVPCRSCLRRFRACGSFARQTQVAVPVDRRSKQGQGEHRRQAWCNPWGGKIPRLRLSGSVRLKPLIHERESKCTRITASVPAEWRRSRSPQWRSTRAGPSSASAQRKRPGYQCSRAVQAHAQFVTGGLDGQRIVHVTDAGVERTRKSARWRSFGESTWPRR